MRTNLEPILAALLTHIGATATSFKTVSRRVTSWTGTDAPEQPALMLRQIAADDIFSGEGLSRTLIECEMWIYQKASVEPTVAPGISLNALVAEVRASFQPDNEENNEYTIGRLAYYCRIEGRTEYAPGDVGDQSIAIIPVKILIP
jgi:hypothetical protein